MAITLTSAHKLYLTADLGIVPRGLIVANRETAGAWERFTIKRLDDTHCAILSHATGQYVCAEGGGGRELVANRDAIGAWETFGWWIRPDGSYSFQAANHLWVAAEEDGRIVANRAEPAEWERFVATEAAEPTDPDPPDHPNPLRGRLHATDRGWMDDSGHVNPHGVMAGDLFLADTEGTDVEPAFESFQRAGYHWWMPWSPLVWRHGEGGPFWGDRAISPLTHSNFNDLLIRHIDRGVRRGMKCMLANGGLHLATNAEETDYYERVRDVIIPRFGPDAVLVPGMVNEPRDTGDADDRDPAELDRLVSIVRARYAEMVLALGSWTGDTPRVDVERLTMPWMTCYTFHGYRDGHWWDKVRHAINNGYEHYRGIRACGINDEDAGPQGQHHHLSVLQNAHEMDSDTMCLLGAAHAISRIAYNFTCSPGIVYDEPFADLPGFFEMPRFIRELPIDLGRYTRQIHSGQTFAGTRVFQALNQTRVDGRIDDDGHFGFIAYGPDITSQIICDRDCVFDLVTTDRRVYPLTGQAGQTLPSIPVTKGYLLRGHVT